MANEQDLMIGLGHVVSYVPNGSLGQVLTANGAGVAPTFQASGVPALPLSLANGGTNASLTANNGGIFYSTASAGAILSGTATAGQMLRSAATAAPTWSTATFPDTATGTGTILRADGTNWSATTATYPNTTTSQQILYSTAANTIGQLTTANSALAATNSSGTLAMRAFSVVTQVFVATGTYTPTTGMIYCEVICVGGGGAGGGAATTGVSTASAGSGGGEGQAAYGVFSAATIGASKAVTIGAGGTGVSGATGNTGGTTSLGTLITAVGGTGGATVAAAAAGSTSGGVGGTGGTVASYSLPGNRGGTCFFSFAAGTGYAGAGSPGRFGEGGDGGAVNANGNAASGNGAGGAGAFNFSSQITARTGGAGAAGIVIVTEYVIN